MITVERIGPIVTPESHPEAGTNINGPALLRVPDWVRRGDGVPDGRYFLYFADHKGSFIRLAAADDPAGPYRWHPGGALALADSRFPTATPRGIEPTSDIQRAAIAAEGYDAHFTPHIASPDIVVDEPTQTIWMAYHGLNPDGTQLTRVAKSRDGVHFEAFEPLIAFPYLRILPQRLPWTGDWLGMAMPGLLYRSSDLEHWEGGPQLFDRTFRHCALLRRDRTLHVIWTRVGDAPEHLLHSTIEMTDDWHDWTPSEPVSLLRPEEPWEGADLPVVASARGQVVTPVHALRDPAILEDGDRTYLLYTVAGESGIAIAQLHL